MGDRRAATRRRGDSFDEQHWFDTKVSETAYAVTTGEVPAWLVSVQRR